MSEKFPQIFTDVPDDLDDTWSHVALFGGMVDLATNDYDLALWFKEASDMLIKYGLKHMDAYELLYPVLFNYRHAMELYLKVITKPEKRNHDLGFLLEVLEKLLLDHHNTEMPMWFKNLISEFVEYDPRSTTFRYAGVTNTNKERSVNLFELHRSMNKLFDAFHRIYLAELSYNKN